MPPRRFFLHVRLVGLLLIGFTALFPLWCLGLAWITSALYGCKVAEDAAHPCMVMGMDLGGLNAVAALSGFMLPVTAAGGVVAGSAWVAALQLSEWVYGLLRARRADRKPSTPI